MNKKRDLFPVLKKRHSLFLVFFLLLVVLSPLCQASVLAFDEEQGNKSTKATENEYAILRISEICETTIEGSCISEENKVDKAKETVTVQKGDECSYEIGDYILVNTAKGQDELRAEEIQNLTQEVLKKKYSSGVDITIADSENIYLSLITGTYESKNMKGIYLYEFENETLRKVTRDFLKDYKVQVEKSGHYLLGVINADGIFEDMTSSVIVESGFRNLPDVKLL